MRKLKPRKTINLPKVTQGENTKVWVKSEASTTSSLLLPVEMGNLSHNLGF